MATSRSGATTPKALIAISSTAMSALCRFEHDHRDAAIDRPRLVVLVAGVELRRELPETFALGALGFAGDVALGPAVSGGFHLRVRLHVVIPGIDILKALLRGAGDRTT